MIKRWTDLAHMFIEQYKFKSEIAPDQEELRDMRKKPLKKFRDYMKMVPGCFPTSICSHRKRNAAIFISILSSTYYDRLIGHASASFANLVQPMEQVQYCIKIRKIRNIRPFLVIKSNRRLKKEKFLQSKK